MSLTSCSNIGAFRYRLAAGRWVVILGWVLFQGLLVAGRAAEPSERGAVLRILPLGDSITRGTYLAHYESGPRQGQPIGLPHKPDGGGWRKLLQDRLRGAGVACDFVGDLRYHSYGYAGVVDPKFDPDHQGLAGFGNQQIVNGGKVPTPADVLAELGVAEILVPDLVTVLDRHRPDVILLMSGANGFDAPARDKLIRLIGDHSAAHLIVATILPQRSPRTGWENVEAYNASLPAVISAQRASGRRITMVDMHTAVLPSDLLADGVHPNHDGLAKIAATWYQGLESAGFIQPAKRQVSRLGVVP